MKKLFLILAALFLMSGVSLASPLDDFSRGRYSLDLSAKPYTYVGSNAFDFTVAAGLGNGWALACRQTDYDTAGGVAVEYRVRSREINILRRLDDNLQLYVGYSRTTGRIQGGPDLAAKNVPQIGLIARRHLGQRLTIFAILGGGPNVTNIEIGASHRLSPRLELTATYRHLTIEKVGPTHAKENLRGFGLGLTMRI